MVESQLPNGLVRVACSAVQWRLSHALIGLHPCALVPKVPDIAPEYTVFNGGFRDSPEWGSSLIMLAEVRTCETRECFCQCCAGGGRLLLHPCTARCAVCAFVPPSYFIPRRRLHIQSEACVTPWLRRVHRSCSLATATMRRWYNTTGPWAHTCATWYGNALRFVCCSLVCLLCLSACLAVVLPPVYSLSSFTAHVFR